jgi:hypothetical protein
VGLADLFGCTFVINLKERKDRRRAVTRELNLAGMPFAPGKVELFNAVRVVEASGFPTPGVRGCFLSHLGVLMEARQRDLPSVLVLEDDVAFSPLINQHFSTLVSALGGKWDFAYLGHVERLSTKPPLSLIPFSGPVVTAHFYAVNGPVLDRLIEYLQQVQKRSPGHPLGGPMHFDGALTMFRQANPDVVTLLAQPNLGWQRSSRSDLHSNWFQSAPVFGEVYDVARYIRRVITKRG